MGIYRLAILGGGGDECTHSHIDLVRSLELREDCLVVREFLTEFVDVSLKQITQVRWISVGKCHGFTHVANIVTQRYTRNSFLCHNRE